MCTLGTHHTHLDGREWDLRLCVEIQGPPPTVQTQSPAVTETVLSTKTTHITNPPTQTEPPGITMIKRTFDTYHNKLTTNWTVECKWNSRVPELCQSSTLSRILCIKPQGGIILYSKLSIPDMCVIKCAIPEKDTLVCLLSVVLDDATCPLEGPMSRLTHTSVCGCLMSEPPPSS